MNSGIADIKHANSDSKMPKVEILSFAECQSPDVTTPIDIFQVVNTLQQHQSNEKQTLIK